MKYANIKLTKEEALKTLTLIESAKEEYEKAKESEDYTIYLIAKEWLEDINTVIGKINEALDEYYKAPF